MSVGIIPTMNFADMTLEELQARLALNKLLMALGSKLSHFEENDALLVEINARLGNLK